MKYINYFIIKRPILNINTNKDIFISLIGFVTQTYKNHFISYFQSYNEDYIENLKHWFNLMI